MGRPDEHSLRVSVGKSILGKGVRSYRWRIVTGFTDESNPYCQPPPPPPPDVAVDYLELGTCVDYSRWTTHTL